MPPALTPELALDYVRELSADVRVAVVLDADRLELLAGPPSLASAAAAFARAAGRAAEIEAVGPRGVVCAARTPQHVMLVVCGRFALPGVVRQDLRVALAAIEGTAPPSPPPPVPAADATDPALAAAADALISAAESQFPA
jgi:hypothetical protein